MRFRTRISNPTVLAKVAQSVEKLSKTVLLKLTSTKLHFIVVAENEGGPQVWSQINNDSLFEDYRIESANDNEISLEIWVEYLLRALRSAQTASDTLLRLTKKDGIPMLSFSITSQNRNGRPMHLTQDVPVRVLSPQQMNNVKEPMCPEPQVHIMMPPLLTLRTIVERMKTMGDYLIVAGNMSGELVLKVEADAVQVETLFTKLINPPLDLSEDEIARRVSTRRDPHLFAEARVEAKSFFKFLHSYHVVPTNVVCCIIENHALVFYVYIGRADGDEGDDGALTYYIPVRNL